MSKINILSFEIANLIAAGEVVERPSSVLKELIENSIDSGATEIVAEIKKGGVSLIRVSDNGCGMEKEDLPIALRRHATSKIREKDDLSNIMTLGFRGEALAAIASVSSLTIISKTKDADVGTMLTADGGEVLDISEVGAADGTIVVVENLFHNVPARRKFLKKDSTEAMNVAALVEKVALSRPDISIQLLIDGIEKFKTPGDNNLLNTVKAVFGREFASKVIKAEGEADGIKVSGFIGRSDNVRKNRNLQNIFINGRYVKSLTVMAALEKAFTSYIAPEAFPTCVLFLEMNPAIVDVNVHPAKLEVKFADERQIFEIVYYTVKTALEQHEYRPELAFGKQKSNYNPAAAFVAIGENTKGEQISLKNTDAFSGGYVKHAEVKASAYNSYQKAQSTQIHSIDNPVPLESPKPSLGGYSFSNSDREVMTPKNSIELLERYRDAKPEQKQESATEKKEPEITVPEHKIIGEAFDCYVMVELEGELLVIDKHAAHERVLFEDLKKHKENDGRVSSQELMLPLSVILTPEELSAAEEYGDDIKSVGFEYALNNKSADITAIPSGISLDDAEALFIKVTDELIEGRGNPTVTESIRREKALYQIACKAAIKGGRAYDKALIEWLVAKLLTIPNITVCPHGRPVAYKVTKSELDRKFDRLK